MLCGLLIEKNICLWALFGRLPTSWTIHMARGFLTNKGVEDGSRIPHGGRLTQSKQTATAIWFFIRIVTGILDTYCKDRMGPLALTWRLPFWLRLVKEAILRQPLKQSAIANRNDISASSVQQLWRSEVSKNWNCEVWLSGKKKQIVHKLYLQNQCAHFLPKLFTNVQFVLP